ncbi:MAG: hypothetical protein KDD73_05835 [Anaerolineales bacterium]|nr:hypothetical protein [Anaerolineales bacterium]
MMILLILFALACGWATTKNPTPTAGGNPVLAGCDRPLSEVFARFDFSERNPTIARIAYPEECWVADSLIFLDSIIEVQLPDGLQVGPHQSARFHVVRSSNGTDLFRVLIEMSGPLSLDDTYAYASSLAERYQMDTYNLDRWYDAYQADPDRIETGRGSTMVRRINDDLGMNIRATLSFYDDRPYVVYLDIVWSSPITLDDTPTAE